MKISEALFYARQKLQKQNISSYKIDSEILLRKALNASKEFIIFNPDNLLTSLQKTEFLDLVKRRENFEPISHIINNREFYGFNFYVNNDVLDPRPDSEILIELVQELYSNKNQNIEILEVGTGSGCLIITLSKIYKNSINVALDISKNALKVANKNSLNNQATKQIEFIESNLFCALENKNKKFNLVISNPPYIPSKEINNLQNEVKNFEPILALDGGEDGLDFYRKIAKDSKNYLLKDSYIILEIGFDQKKEIVEIFEKENFQFVKSKKDLANIERSLAFKFSE
jgi:release factor glutamine methyltransferase